MRSANLLNDFAFKYVFGEDCKEANDALKSLLTVFLERKVNHVVVKNSEMVKDYDMEGKSYSQLKETIVMVFFNLIIADDDDICSLYTMRKYSGIPLVKDEKEDRMKLMTIEMPKVDLNKPLEDMNEQEKMIYYFLNCHKGLDDSKIKVMIESDGMIQMLEKRVETISDDRWKKIIEDFQKLHENEERIELQLELEEAQRQMKEARKDKEEVRKDKEEARKEKEEAHKEKEEARKTILEADKKVKQMVCKMYEDGFTLEQISAYCSLNVDEIELLIKS